MSENCFRTLSSTSNDDSLTMANIIAMVEKKKLEEIKKNAGGICNFVCDALNNNDSPLDTKGNAAKVVGILVDDVVEFRNVINTLQDGALASNLCNLLGKGEKQIRGNAARAIASLVENSVEFREIIVKTASFQNGSLAANLCNLTNGVENPNNNAARAIASLVQCLPEFGKEIVKIASFRDGSLATNLCNLLESADDNEKKSNAARTIGILVENVDAFRMLILANSSFQDGSLATNLCNLLANGSDDGKANAAEAIRCLSAKIKAFERFLSAPAIQEIILDIDSAEIELGSKIAAGEFGKVYKGKWKGENVAIKRLLIMNDAMSKDAAEEIKKEAKLVRNDDGIVALRGISVLEDRLCLLTEWMDRGSLYDILHNSIDYPEISWKIIYQMALDAARGLAYLHKSKILHRDMKSMNVLVNGEWRAKLCDFGMSKAKLDTATKITSKTQVRWMAPELFKLNPVHSTATDVFGLGVVFWEIASRRLPYGAADDVTIREEVKQGEREEIPSDCPSYFGNLISRCWSQDASHRPSAQEVVDLLESRGDVFDYPAGHPNWEEIQIKLQWTKDASSNSFESVTLNDGGGAHRFVMEHFGNPSTIYVTRVEAVRNGELISRFGQFGKLREAGAEPFNVEFDRDGEKEVVFKQRMQPHFIKSTGYRKTHMLYGWHGCSLEAAQSICAGGTKDLRKSDGGFFGAGMYFTLQSEYAAGYSTGTCNVHRNSNGTYSDGCFTGAGNNQVEDKEYAMVFVEICVGNVYPITRKAEYPANSAVSLFCYEEQQVMGADGIMRSHRTDKAMKAGFDCHFISVSSKASWQATWTLDERQEGQICDEIVVKDSAQVVPLAIVYFRPKYPKITSR